MPSLAQPTDAFWGSSADRELDVGETPGDGGCRHRLRCDRDDGHPDAAINSVAEIIRAGAVRVNLEDGTPRGAAPIRNIAPTVVGRRARPPGPLVFSIVINARTDLYLRSIGDEAGRVDESVARRRACLVAGADCFYPIAFARPATIARLMKAPAAPTNIMVRAGLPIVAELEALGVARAGTASAVSLMAMATTRQIAEEPRKTGSFDTLAPAMTQADVQRLFAAP